MFIDAFNRRLISFPLVMISGTGVGGAMAAVTSIPSSYPPVTTAAAGGGGSGEAAGAVTIESLTASLTEYQTQLASISEVLADLPAGSAEHTDMLNLQSSLIELSTFTADSITRLQSVGQSRRSTATNPAAVSAPPAHRVGERCQVLYWTTRGDGLWLDAIVFAVRAQPARPTPTAETDEFGADRLQLPSGGAGATAQYTVLFTTPLHKSLKTCPSLLSDESSAGSAAAGSSGVGVCPRYGAACGFGHGYVTSEQNLRSLSAKRSAEQGVSALRAGEHCLARYSSDGLWYEAVIKQSTSIGFEVHIYRSWPLTPVFVCSVYGDGSMLVQYNEYRDSAPESVASSDVCHMPVPIHTGDTGSDRADRVAYDDDAADAKLPAPSGVGGGGGGGGSFSLRAAFAGTGSGGGDSSIGGWQAHTNGIGFKLLAKFGYSIGGGLGKDGRGRSTPVLPGAVVPKRTALDYISPDSAFSRAVKASAKTAADEAKAAADERELRRRHSQQNSVFDFLNRISNRAGGLSSNGNGSGNGNKRKRDASPPPQRPAASPPPAPAVPSRALTFASDKSTLVIPAATTEAASSGGGSGSGSGGGGGGGISTATFNALRRAVGPDPGDAPATGNERRQSFGGGSDSNGSDPKRRKPNEAEMRKRLLEIQNERRSVSAQIAKHTGSLERNKKDATASLFAQRLKESQAQLAALTSQEQSIAASLTRRKSASESTRF